MINPNLKKRRNTKGQVAVEFIMLFGVTFFIFIALLGVSVYYSQQQDREKVYLVLQDLTYKMKLEFDLASTASDGYCRNFNIPVKLNYKEYNITVTNKELVVRQNQYEYSALLPVFTGTIVKGTNKICKTGGVIHLN